MYQVCFIDTGDQQEFTEADSFKTLKEAVDDYTSAGWEDGERVRRQAVIIKDGNGNIAAVGSYVDFDKDRLPMLVWVYAHGTIENRYHELEYARHFGKEA
jgi:hypothetical protein